MAMVGSLPGVASTSLSAIVPTAVPSRIVAPLADDSCTVKLSVSSVTVSASTGMAKVLLVSPGAKVTVPTVDV